MSENQPKRVYEIKHVYLKDASFESPQAPKVFTQKAAQPNIELDVNIINKHLNDEKTVFDTVLYLRVTAKTEDQTLFLTEVEQAAIIEISGFSDKETHKLLNVAVPNALLPFARECVANLTSKGGFPQFIIRPLNFEHIYTEKLKAQQEKVQGKQTEH